MLQKAHRMTIGCRVSVLFLCAMWLTGCASPHDSASEALDKAKSSFETSSVLFGWLYEQFGALTAFGWGAGLALITATVLTVRVRT